MGYRSQCPALCFIFQFYLYIYIKRKTGQPELQTRELELYNFTNPTPTPHQPHANPSQASKVLEGCMLCSFFPDSSLSEKHDRWGLRLVKALRTTVRIQQYVPFNNYEKRNLCFVNTPWHNAYLESVSNHNSLLRRNIFSYILIWTSNSQSLEEKWRERFTLVTPSILKTYSKLTWTHFTNKLNSFI